MASNNRYHHHPQAGILTALFSLLLGCAWMVITPPLSAPDEPAHLQAVMELRKTWRLPEIHYDFTADAGGRVVGNPGDADTRAYASQFHFYPNLLIPYESMQPPLYYLAAAAASSLVPPNPVPVLYISRFVSVICGAATVYVAWALARELAPNSPPAWATGTALFVSGSIVKGEETAVSDVDVIFVASDEEYQRRLLSQELAFVLYDV